MDANAAYSAFYNDGPENGISFGQEILAERSRPELITRKRDGGDCRAAGMWTAAQMDALLEGRAYEILPSRNPRSLNQIWRDVIAEINDPKVIDLAERGLSVTGSLR